MADPFPGDPPMVEGLHRAFYSPEVRDLQVGVRAFCSALRGTSELFDPVGRPLAPDFSKLPDRKAIQRRSIGRSTHPRPFYSSAPVKRPRDTEQLAGGHEKHGPSDYLAGEKVTIARLRVFSFGHLFILRYLPLVVLRCAFLL